MIQTISQSKKTINLQYYQSSNSEMTKFSYSFIFLAVLVFSGSMGVLKLNPSKIKSSITSLLYSTQKKRDMGDAAAAAAVNSSLVLHGMWASPFVKRVELALKLKGIPFEYVEEDLQNKNPETILKYNPVYKKVPVLVHNGKPISESLVILEYIDEVWKGNGPSLLPHDPYKRAQARFWADFIHKQVFEGTAKAVMAGKEEAVEKAINKVKEKLKVLEEHGLKSLLMKENGSPFVNGDELGVVDIAMWSVLGAYKIHEEVLGFKIVEEEETPQVFLWLKRLIEHPLAKDILPSKERIVGLLQYVRSNALKSSAAA